MSLAAVGAGGVVRPGAIGQPPTDVAGGTEMGIIRVEVEEIIDQGSGITASAAFAVANVDGAAFGNGQDDLTDFVKSFPPTWKGQTIGVFVALHHRDATRTGSAKIDADIIYLSATEQFTSIASFDDSLTATYVVDAGPDDWTHAVRIWKIGEVTWPNNAGEGAFYMRVRRNGTDGGDDFGNFLYLDEIIIGPEAEITDDAITS